ncbi:MAG: ATP-binding protein, partial [Acidobacteria bacterium]|nr:ATP-binding protein [Acidobacteriota bacterium]
GSEQIEIAVCDTGPGIPENILHKLFEPFFTTKPTGKGTGMGLSVSFGIIKDHGGDIRPESKPGEGAAFIITLPICKIAAQETSLTPQPVA